MVQGSRNREFFVRIKQPNSEEERYNMTQPRLTPEQVKETKRYIKENPTKGEILSGGHNSIKDITHFRQWCIKNNVEEICDILEQSKNL